jgi:putative acetyltransferase
MVISRTNGLNSVFIDLVGMLDSELWERYPDTMHLYEKGNIVDENARAVIAFEKEVAAGCGCLRLFPDNTSIELKRMFVKKEFRGNGYSKLIVSELLKWAKELKRMTVYLETGIKQPEAVGLYECMGFYKTDNYGEYAGNPESICMKKEL